MYIRIQYTHGPASGDQQGASRAVGTSIGMPSPTATPDNHVRSPIDYVFMLMLMLMLRPHVFYASCAHVMYIYICSFHSHV